MRSSKSIIIVSATTISLALVVLAMFAPVGPMLLLRPTLSIVNVDMWSMGGFEKVQIGLRIGGSGDLTIADVTCLATGAAGERVWGTAATYPDKTVALPANFIFEKTTPHLYRTTIPQQGTSYSLTVRIKGTWAFVGHVEPVALEASSTIQFIIHVY